MWHTLRKEYFFQAKNLRARCLLTGIYYTRIWSHITKYTYLYIKYAYKYIYIHVHQIWYICMHIHQICIQMYTYTSTCNTYYQSCHNYYACDCYRHCYSTLAPSLAPLSCDHHATCWGEGVFDPDAANLSLATRMRQAHTLHAQPKHWLISPKSYHMHWLGLARFG